MPADEVIRPCVGGIVERDRALRRQHHIAEPRGCRGRDRGTEPLLVDDLAFGSHPGPIDSGPRWGPLRVVERSVDVFDEHEHSLAEVGAFFVHADPSELHGERLNEVAHLDVVDAGETQRVMR